MITSGFMSVKFILTFYLNFKQKKVLPNTLAKLFKPISIPKKQCFLKSTHNKNHRPLFQRRSIGGFINDQESFDSD